MPSSFWAISTCCGPHIVGFLPYTHPGKITRFYFPRLYLPPQLLFVPDICGPHHYMACDVSLSNKAITVPVLSYKYSTLHHSEISLHLHSTPILSIQNFQKLSLSFSLHY